MHSPVTNTALTVLPLRAFSWPRIRSRSAPIPKTPNEQPIPATLRVETEGFSLKSLTSIEESDGVGAKIEEFVTRMSMSPGRSPDCESSSCSAPPKEVLISLRHAS